MVSPSRRPCGVADYTDHLLCELRRLVEVAHTTDPESFAPAMNEVDLIHIQHQYFLFGGVAPWKARFKAFAKRLGAPAVMTVHEFVSPEGNPLQRATIAITNRIHFRHPAIRRLIVHTKPDRGRMLGDGIPANRISVVRHGVPDSPSLPDRDEARCELGVEDRFVVTLFGFISRKKGHRVALKALQYLPKDVFLLIAGGKHPDDETSYVSELKQILPADRARITGYLPPEEVARAMSATDLVVAPFTESSGSGSLALALACGKPILASDIPPHREIEADSPGALALFPSEDSEALSRSMEDLRQNSASLAGLAEGATRYAATHSYARAARETVEVYEEVLAEAVR